MAGLEVRRFPTIRKLWRAPITQRKGHQCEQTTTYKTLTTTTWLRKCQTSGLDCLSPECLSNAQFGKDQKKSNARQFSSSTNAGSAKIRTCSPQLFRTLKPHRVRQAKHSPLPCFTRKIIYPMLHRPWNEPKIALAIGWPQKQQIPKLTHNTFVPEGRRPPRLINLQTKHDARVLALH